MERGFFPFLFVFNIFQFLSNKIYRHFDGLNLFYWMDDLTVEMKD